LLSEWLEDWSDEDVTRLTELMTRFRHSFGDCLPSARPGPPPC